MREQEWETTELEDVPLFGRDWTDPNGADDTADPDSCRDLLVESSWF
jgi:hypothetical protein